MILVHTLLAITLTINVAAAQNVSHPLMVSRDDASSHPRIFRTAADTIDVLAVMVQFQTDNDTRTNGNGQFDLSAPADIGLDSPPHNRRYFEDHLTFLANYYRKVSKGRTLIRATLVDTTFTLADQMARYSPPKNGPNTVVGDLARDAWTRVSASGRVPDFSRYECFVVFHAGVGRDVDVAATLGFDPAPLDIPSLYLGLNAFRSFYGETYQGIPVRNSFTITNSIIIPETETRELPATPDNILLRLGINGLFCASVGNFLGLPDLFNTADGRSGIGRFGLMDGQSIFSFGGAFPPEPSAWEKYWLGWIQPIIVPPGETIINVPAVAIADSIYRIPISASEYCLVENRNRDAGRNGQQVTISYNGTISQKSYQRDTVGFNAFSLTDIRGTVIDVDDLDWSLPGGVGATTNEFFDGGILIWHIDESVIAQGLATNGVNASPNRRGVDVEEADGSQDIGQSYGQLEAGSGSEEGTAFDFWYQGNIAPVYRNEFSATSYPDNTSNSGANSHFTIKEFSRRGTRMTARVTVGDDVALLPNFPKNVTNSFEKNSLTAASLNGTPAILAVAGKDASGRLQRGGTSAGPSTLYAWTLDGRTALRPSTSDGAFAIVETPGSSFVNSVAVEDLNNDGVSEVVVGQIVEGAQTPARVLAYTARPRTGDSLANPYFSRPASQRFSTSPLIGDSTIAFGGAKGKTFYYRFSGVPIDSVQRFSDSSGIVGVSQIRGRNTVLIVSERGAIDIVTPNAAVVPPTERNFSRTIVGPAAVGLFGSDERIAFATSDGFLYATDRSFNPISGFPLNTGASILHSPAFGDLDGDGKRDIIIFSGRTIHAYNQAAASLDNFPKLIPSTQSITSNPVVADVDGDGDADVVAVSEDGLVVAYDRNGQMANGFPLQAGRGSQSVAAFSFPAQSLSATYVGLAVASSGDGSVNAWRTGTVGGNRRPLLPWPQYQHDAQHTGLATEPLTGMPLSAAFFPKERAYNWPNPVNDGKTYIRYFVGENATVKIKIFDLAGDVVTELNGPGVGGVDNEVEWKVGDVQSGVYIARIEASGGGKSETAIVKVAVVK